MWREKLVTHSKLMYRLLVYCIEDSGSCMINVIIVEANGPRLWDSVFLDLTLVLCRNSSVTFGWTWTTCPSSKSNPGFWWRPTKTDRRTAIPGAPADGGLLGQVRF